MAIQRSKMKSRRTKEWNKIRIKISISNGNVLSVVIESILRIVWIYTCYEIHEIHAWFKVLSVTNVGRNVAFGLNGRIMRSWACTVGIMSVWQMWNKPWRDYGLNSHMESEHTQSDSFHVLSVEMGTWISASWVITWIECVQSEDFLHNICKKNIVGIDELKIHMKWKCVVR